MRKKQTWKDNINNAIRYVLFPDAELLDLMMIPDGDRENIVKFIDKYFIRNAAPDEIVSTEDVRICYSEEEGRLIGANMIEKYICFDVYVQNDHLHDCGDDFLVFRTDKICQKLKELLTDEKSVQGISYRYKDDFYMYTKLVGYSRHRLVLSYKASF